MLREYAGQRIRAIKNQKVEEKVRISCEIRKDRLSIEVIKESLKFRKSNYEIVMCSQ